MRRLTLRVSLFGPVVEERLSVASQQGRAYGGEGQD